MTTLNYRALVAYGFSPAKALEIELDAKRGDSYAQDWIGLARLAADEKNGISTLGPLSEAIANFRRNP